MHMEESSSIEKENDPKPIFHHRKKRHKGQRKDHHFKLFKTPAEITRAMLTAGESKANYPPQRVIFLAFLAGVAISMATHLCVLAAAVLNSPPAGTYELIFVPQARRMIFGFFLPVALVTIILLGGELYTGNTMAVMVAIFSRTIPVTKGLYNMGGVWLGNFMGAVAYAYFISYSSGLFEDEPYASVLQTFLVGKTDLTFLEAFLRGIGGNGWVCIAVLFSTAAEDVAGKIMGTYIAIFSMACSGYEHIILNMYLLILGLMNQAGNEVSFYDVWFKNFLPVFIGNTVVGWAIGATVYFLFLHNTVIPVVETPVVPKDQGRVIPESGKNEFAMVKSCFTKLRNRSSSV